MSIILNILLFIVILGFIIFIHEFGHFTWAKICGVYVYEFALGMGPKIFGFKGKETEYSLRAIPIGGYCQLAGEDIDDDDIKKVPKKRITMVEKGSAAEKAGLEANDVITSINGHKVTTSDDISLFLAVANPEKKTTIKVDRDGNNETIKVKPTKIKVDGEETYKYGIGIQQEKEYGFVAALKYMVNKSKSLFKQMGITFGYLVTGGIRLNQLSGPVGIYSIVGEQAKTGLANILYLVAYLSINVGFINLLPLPAFDGGHILFIIIEKLRGKPVSPELENKIHTIGMILLLLLMLVVTVNDIIKLF